MKFNYMTELSATILELPRIINTAVDEIQLYDRVMSATILELIYENNKDSVRQNNPPVNGEHQQTN